MTVEQIKAADKLQSDYENLLKSNASEEDLKNLCQIFAKENKVPLAKATKLARCELTVEQVEKMFKR